MSHSSLGGMESSNETAGRCFVFVMKKPPSFIAVGALSEHIRRENVFTLDFGLSEHTIQFPSGLNVKSSPTEKNLETTSRPGLVTTPTISNG